MLNMDQALFQKTLLKFITGACTESSLSLEGPLTVREASYESMRQLRILGNLNVSNWDHLLSQGSDSTLTLTLTYLMLEFAKVATIPHEMDEKNYQAAANPLLYELRRFMMDGLSQLSDDQYEISTLEQPD